jgi:VanZ family protein
LWRHSRLVIFQGSALLGLGGGLMTSPTRLIALAVIYAAAIWVIGGVENPPQVYAPGLSLDKVAHFVMYAGLGLLVGRAWALSMRGWTWVLPLLLILLLGAADEIRQGGLAERAAEFADWIADAAGASVGFLLSVKLTRRTRQIEDNERE